MPITVCHLYPDLLNLNGDRGNIIAFVQRCRWRNIKVQLREIKYGHPVDVSECDFVFIGGGSDQGQALALVELGQWTDQLRAAVDKGLVLLAIGEGFQLLGQYYIDAAGFKKGGLGLLPAYTELTGKRISGRVVVEVELGGIKTKLVGFENHGGKTFLNGTNPLGRVLYGQGNNGQDGLEGARYKNMFCTYLQGPLLPQNPSLTDYLIRLVLQQKNLANCLEALDDSMEELVREAAMKQILA